MHSAECRTRIGQATKAASDESRLIEAGLRQAVAGDGQGIALNAGGSGSTSTLAVAVGSGGNVERQGDGARLVATGGVGDAEMTSGSAIGDSTALAASTQSDLQTRSPGVVRARDETGGDEHLLKRQAMTQPRGVIRKHEDVSLGDPRVDAAPASAARDSSSSTPGGHVLEAVTQDTGHKNRPLWRRALQLRKCADGGRIMHRFRDSIGR